MIPVWEPMLDGNEKKYAEDCLDTGWVSSMGKYIPLFEEAFAGWVGRPFGVACSSCTTGLHMAMVALGIGPGDEVIIPDFTLIVSANTVIQAGARPVFVDVDPVTWCIDPAAIAKKITPRTKAIMAVHMYGHPCDMYAIGVIAKQHDLAVIEDCAEAHGAEVRGRMVGGFGHVAAFSFYGNKILTTGEGGMLLVSDEGLAKRLRMLRDQAFGEPRFVHDRIGWNYRMTNVQAAIGLAQTERADAKVEAKRRIGKAYAERLGGVPGLVLPAEAEWAKSVYWMYGVVLGDEWPSRAEVMAAMKERGVATRAFFWPMHWQLVFENPETRRTIAESAQPDCSGEYPVSTWLGRRGLYLPSGLTVTDQQMNDVVAALVACRGGR
jgi:perosamine synthetase